MTREEDITCDFFVNDKIWPPICIADPSHPFMVALAEVLRRLPEEVYDQVSETVSFVVDDERITAVNVPFERDYPFPMKKLTVKFDTIVIFHRAFAYSPDALIGLLAHEIAHSFVNEPNSQDDEKAADAEAVRWGFGEELNTLRAEHKKA